MLFRHRWFVKTRPVSPERSASGVEGPQGLAIRYAAGSLDFARDDSAFRALTIKGPERYALRSVMGVNYFMKRIFASLFVALVSFPVAGLACGGGGDCDGMVLPPPEVPAPGPAENLLSSLTDHAGLLAGMALAALIGYVVSRQRKLLETGSAAPSFGGTQ